MMLLINCCPKVMRTKPICFSLYISLQLGLWISYLLQCLRRPIPRILLHLFIVWGDTRLHKLCVRNRVLLQDLRQEFLRGYRQQFYWSCGRRGFRIWLQGLLHIHRNLYVLYIFYRGWSRFQVVCFIVFSDGAISNLYHLSNRTNWL